MSEPSETEHAAQAAQAAQAEQAEHAEKRSSYRQILKATSLFGGVQVFNILIAVIRSKFVAVLLGPAGMGLGGLFASTTEVIRSLTSLGLATSAIKDIAAANATGDERRIATIVTVFRRLVWVTGLAGTLITLVLAPWLSEIAFGTREHTLGFVAVSTTLLLGQLAAGQRVLLQGMRRLKDLAAASVLGATAGLLCAVPMYWFYGNDGIVPAIVVGAITNLATAAWFGRRVRVERVAVSLKETLHEGKGMVTMGVVIALNGLLLSATVYLLRIFISWAGTVDDVGLYSAGFSIINQYVGMVFTAMLTDYYPRLSAVAHDDEACTQTINQQADVAVLILGPIILAFMVFVKLAVIILYSEKFLAIDQMMNWAAIGILFKAASWAVGFVFVPKGDSRLFIISEFVANAYMLLINMAGYYWFGLEGLGVAFLVAYVVYLLQVVLIARARYNFRFEVSFFRLFAAQLALAVACFLSVRLISSWYGYGIGLILILISTRYSYRELDKRIGMKAAIETVLAKVRRRLGRT